MSAFENDTVITIITIYSPAGAHILVIEINKFSKISD